MSARDRPLAVITGGTGGVGRAACRLMVDRGYHVELTYRSNEEAARRLESDLGATCVAHQLDLTDQEATAALVADVTERHGRIDTVIHAAGPYVEQRYVSQFSAGQLEEHLRSELMAFFHIVTPALEHLRRTGGSIVAVTTFAIRKFPPRDALSSIPKAGIEAMVRAIAAEEGKYGIRANCVGPGALADGMTDVIRETGDIPHELIETVIPSIPLRRLGTGEDVAHAVAFLASADAAYITGQSIDVDGGFQL